jgi:hypothetical protein
MSKHESDLSEFKKQFGDTENEEFNEQMKRIRPLSEIGTNLGKCLIKSIDRAGVSKNVLIRENVRCEKSLDTWIFSPFLKEGYQDGRRRDLHFIKDARRFTPNDIKTLTLLTIKLTDLFQRDLGLGRDLSITNESWFKKQLVIEQFVEQLESVTEKLREGNGGN